MRYKFRDCFLETLLSFRCYAFAAIFSRRVCLLKLCQFHYLLMLPFFRMRKQIIMTLVEHSVTMKRISKQKSEQRNGL
jgi:hypothetical protein